MPELNGQVVSIPSEIRNTVDHAGLLEPLKLYLTGSVSQLMELPIKCYLHRTWFLVILETWDATVAGWIQPGTISMKLVLSLTLASHMNLEMDKNAPVEHLALMENPSQNTNVKRSQRDSVLYLQLRRQS